MAKINGFNVRSLRQSATGRKLAINKAFRKVKNGSVVIVGIEKSEYNPGYAGMVQVLYSMGRKGRPSNEHATHFDRLFPTGSTNLVCRKLDGSDQTFVLNWRRDHGMFTAFDILSV